MNKEKIIEVIKEKTDSIESFCNKISIDFDKEQIHEFRVDFKYLRSFLRLIRMHNNNKGPKLPEKLKKLYSIAGIIRDTQIELDNITKNELGLQDYTLVLNKSLSLQKNEWNKNYDNKILNSFKKQTNSYNFPDMPAGVLANFLNTRMESIDANINVSSPTDVQMHSVRKDAKDIIYTTDVAKKKNWSGTKDNLKRLPIKELTQVANEIGHYNDERQQLERISQFSQQTAEPETKEKIIQIKNLKEPKMKKQKLNIINLVKELFIKN